MLSHLIVTALIAFSINALPLESTRKCSPPQSEGAILGKIGQEHNGQPSVGEIVGRVFVDYETGQEATLESVYFGGKLVANYTFLVTNEGSYLADTTSKKCVKMPGIKVEQPCNDSPSLNYVTSLSVGSEMLDVYSYTINGKKGTTNYLRSSFIPVSGVVEQTVGGYEQLIAIQFGNMTTGIKDRRVFDKPSYC